MCSAAVVATATLLLTCLQEAAAQITDVVVAEAETGAEVWFEPSNLLQVIEGTSHTVHWYTATPAVTSVSASVQDKRVARVGMVGPVVESSLETGNYTFTGTVNISAVFVGYNKLRVVLFDGREDVVGEAELSMSVLLAYQKLSDLFMLIISVLVAILYVVMGASLDLEVIKKIAKKPLGPLVGMVCQYLFMPLIAFGLAKITFPDNPLGQLGLFLAGCCPGGGASNIWTHLLGGSLDLSIMMTFVSTLAAFASVPLWVLLMGPVIMGDTDFVIPYKDIMVLVFSLSVPCALGMLIGRFLPRVGSVLSKLLTPLSLFNVGFLFSFGVYANLYLFELFDSKTILAGFGLPTLGYLSGLALSWLLRLPMKDRVAISIETGIQNMTIALIILKLTLEAPAAELTVEFPAAAVIMTPIPLIFAFIIRRIYLWRCDPQEDEKLEKEQSNKMEKRESNEETKGRKGERNGTVRVEEEDGIDGGIDNPAAEL